MVKVSERKDTMNGRRLSKELFGNEEDNFEAKLSMITLLVGVASHDRR